jgi:small subunit ribosomal protein S9
MTEDYYRGTGRRKESIARVRLAPGSGEIAVNGHSLEEYFPVRRHRLEILAPLVHLDLRDKYDINARLNGGGVSGQAGAMRLGIARALVEVDDSLRAELKKEGFLSRDARMKERKKYGLRSARKKPQFSKR